MTGVLRIDALLSVAHASGSTKEDVEEALELERLLWPKLKPKETDG